VVWTEAERLIHHATHADVFLIMDCCHAGKLLNMKAQPTWSDRIFEFLGACSAEETTFLPGPDSFTSALIWGLEKLAEEKGAFTNPELFEQILQAPKFPSGRQQPCYNERGIHCPMRLILEPLKETLPETATRALVKSEETAALMEYCLTLDFLLPSLPNEQDLKKMCDGLKNLIKSKHIVARQILWRGLISKEASQLNIPRVVREWLMKTRARREEKHLSKSGNTGDIEQSVKNLNSGDGASLGLRTPVSEGSTVKRAIEELDTMSDEDGSQGSPSKRQKMR